VAIRRAIAVLDALEVAISRAYAVALVGLCAIDVVVVLLGVLVDDSVALVVVALADQPAEDTSGMLRIRGRRVEDSGLRSLTVKRRDVVTRDQTPVDLTGRHVGPALDSGEQPLNTGAVAVDDAARGGSVVLKPCAVRLENRHQVFSTREE